MTDNKQMSETDKPMSSSKDKGATGDNAASTKQAAGSAEAKQSPANSEHNESIKETLNKTIGNTGQAATEVVGQAKEKAVSLIGEQKAGLASGINSVADSIRQIGENLRNDGEQNQIVSLAGRYGDSLAGQVEKFSQYVEQSDFKEVAQDLERFARRNPAVFVGGAFALGILAARFLKSSGSGQTGKKGSRKNSTGVRSTGAGIQAS